MEPGCGVEIMRGGLDKEAQIMTWGQVVVVDSADTEIAGSIHGRKCVAAPSTSHTAHARATPDVLRGWMETAFPPLPITPVCFLDKHLTLAIAQELWFEHYSMTSNTSSSGAQVSTGPIYSSSAA